MFADQAGPIDPQDPSDVEPALWPEVHAGINGGVQKVEMWSNVRSKLRIFEGSRATNSSAGAKGGGVRVNYAIVFVSDMKRAVSFYRDVVGLPLKFESPGWTEFATEGATLALHVSEGPSSERDDPQTVPAGRCRPGLSVPNLGEFHKRMVARNVPCVQEPKQVFGAWIAQYLDPDGLAISVGEERRSARPSETAEPAGPLT